MSKFLLNLWLILSFFSFLYAEEVSLSNSATASYYEKNQKAYAFGGRINVRSAATTKSKKVYGLKDGEEITLLNREEKTEKIGQRENPWYKVKNKEGKIGYMFGTFIALHKFSGEGTDFFLLGQEEKDPKSFSLRYFSQNKLSYTVKIPSIPVSSLSASFQKDYPGKGLSLLLLKLNEGDSCPSSTQYLLYEVGSKKANLLRKKVGGADPPVSQVFLYKFQKDKKGNTMIEEREELTDDEDSSGKPIYSSIVNRTLVYKNGKIQQVKETKIK
ncbi:MAG: SH3 domain-containing protein [Leptospiraceae bacterium]|nr:SH3 domain-containing protein [Leptospiraceae bacterium]MCP5502015.1 SH3 domain-containing protein [Leptospiraceae bacterium]